MTLQIPDPTEGEIAVAVTRLDAQWLAAGSPKPTVTPDWTGPGPALDIPETAGGHMMARHRTFPIGAALSTLALSLCSTGPTGAQPADTPWAMFQHDLLNTGRSPLLGPRFDAGTPSTEEVKKWNGPDKIKMYPVLDSDGTVYVGMGFVFCAINPDMTKKWCTRLGADVSSSAAALDRAGYIYVGDRDNSMTKFDRCGKIIWKFNHGFEGDVWASPKILRDGTVVYAHDQTTDGIGVVTALNPADGSRKWFHVTGKGIRESPAVDASDNIYFSASSSILIYAANGDLLWEVPIGSGGLSAPVIDTQRSVLYVGSTAGLIAVNVSDMATTRPQVKWTFTTTGKAGQPVLASDGVLFIGSRLTKDKHLYAVGPGGHQRWHYGPVQIEADEPLRPILGSDNVVYVGLGGRVHAFSPAGVKLWTFATTNQIIDFFAIGKVAGKATLYAGSNDWKLYAITEKGGATAPGPRPCVAASAGADQTVTVGEPVAFDGSGSSGDPDSLTYAWDFGDGARGTGPNPLHAYQAAGNYTVTLAVTDGGLTASDTLVVSASVGGPPGSSFRDSFTRPGPGLGNGWVSVAGTLSIAGNEVQSKAGGGYQNAVQPSFVKGAQTVTARFNSPLNNPGPRFGVVLRYQNPGNYYLAYRASGGTSALRISRIVNGSETILKSVGFPNPAVNTWFTITGQAAGSTLTLKADGVLKLTVTDTTFSTGSVGMMLGSVPAAATSYRADDFLATAP